MAVERDIRRTSRDAASETNLADATSTMELSLLDIAKLVAVVAATITITLLWVHRSSQTHFVSKARNSYMIAARIMAVHAFFIWVLCGRNSVPVDVYIVIVGVAFILCAVMASGGSMPGGGDLMSAVIFSAIMGPVLLLMLFVFGLPDKELLIPEPDVSVPKRDPPPRACDTGTAVSALRPMGTIELAGERFNACSAMGTIIDVGTPIRVCGQRGELLLVEVLES